MRAEVAGIDFSDENFLLDPWPVYRKLRHTAPVHWAPGANAYVVLRHADVSQMLLDPRLTTNFPTRLLKHLFGATLADTEDEEHRILRRMFAPFFGARAMKEFVSPLIIQVVDEVLAGLASTSLIDFRTQVAIPVPYEIATRLLGLPADDIEWLHEKVTALAAALDFPSGPLDAAYSARGDLDNFLRQAEIKSHLDTGYPTLLHALQNDGVPTGSPEFTRNALFFLLALTATSVSAICTTIATQLSNAGPGRWPSTDEIPRVVRETFRWEPAVHQVLRYTTEKFELHGVPIDRYQPVLLSLASANRDEEAFEEPERWWPGRPKQRSFTFGAGAHACLGTQLITAEIEYLMRELGTRFTDIQLAAPVGPMRSLAFRGPESLTIRWVPKETFERSAANAR